MDSCSPEKKKLIEEIGVHFEKVHNLAPLAARIYVIMILSPNDGHTFDEIIQITEASKSSVSTQLNLLLQMNKVEYFTKPGDRKRYFRASKTYLKNTLIEHLDQINKDIRLVEKVHDFNKAFNKEKFENNSGVTLLYKEYLIAQKINLENTIDKMNKILN